MKLYAATTGWVAISAIRDLMEITAGGTRSIRIHEVRVSQSSDYGDTEAEGLEIRLLRYSGSFSAGAGGSSAIGSDPYSSDNLPAESAVVDRTHSTLAATGTGQEDVLLEDTMNVQAGWHWLPPPELRVDVSATDAFVVRLVTAPTDSVDISCTVIYEEL